jgi:hypothetical protein
MQFQYEIPADEYVAAQTLYLQLTINRRATRGIFWVLLGSSFIALAVSGVESWLESLPLACLGAWWIYVGFVRLFPGWYFRRAYPKSSVVGKSYNAGVNQDGFDVSGDEVSWTIKWASVKVKGENASVFIFYAANTIFIFGKKFLNAAQQQELRQLSGLRPQ